MMASTGITVDIDDDIKRNAQKLLEYINAELDKSMLEAANPNTKWLSQDEMKARSAKRR
jgi:hypothetical protein